MFWIWQAPFDSLVLPPDQGTTGITIQASDIYLIRPIVFNNGSTLDIFWFDGEALTANRKLWWGHSTNWGQNWSVTEIVNYTDDNLMNLIAAEVDSNGKVHIVYGTSSSPYKLQYITNKTGSWVDTEIYSQTTGIYCPNNGGAMLLDGDNIYVLVGFGSPPLSYMVWYNGTSWTSSTMNGYARLQNVYVNSWLFPLSTGDIFVASSQAGDYDWVTFDPDTNDAIAGGTFLTGVDSSYVVMDQREGTDYIDVYYSDGADIHHVTNATGSFVDTEVLNDANTWVAPHGSNYQNDKHLIYQYESGKYYIVWYASNLGPPSGYIRWDSNDPTNVSNTFTRPGDASSSRLWSPSSSFDTQAFYYYVKSDYTLMFSNEVVD